MVEVLTLFAADAHRVATTDRTRAADAVLGVAVDQATRLVRSGQPGRAEYVMARAGMRVDRILGKERAA